MKRKYCYYIFILILFFYALTSCNLNNKREKELLDIAESLLSINPDSTLQLLDSILFPENLDDKLFHKYILVDIQARHKSNKNIEHDTLVFNSKRYYAHLNDIENAALSAFYIARVIEAQERSDRSIMSAYSEAEYLANKTTNTYLKAQIKTYLGAQHQKQRFVTKAVECYKSAESYFEELNDVWNITEIYNKIGNAYITNMEVDSALYYYEKGLKLAKSQNDSNQQACVIQNIGVTLAKKHQYQEARDTLKASLKYLTYRTPEEYVKDENISRVYLNTAMIFNWEGKKDSALAYIQKLEAFDPEKTNPVLQSHINNVLSSIEEKEENYKKALSHKKEYIKYLDKKLENKNSQAIIAIQKKYNYEQYRTENSRLTIYKQNITITALVLAIIVILLIAFFIGYWQKYKEEKLMAEQKIYHLQKLKDSYNKKNNSMRNIILDHFNILKKTALMEGYMREEERKQGQNQKLLKKFNETVYGQDTLDWEKIFESLNHIYNGFCDKLRKACPNLDESEFKICCLTYAELSNTDISIITNYKVNSIQAKKYSIRKKLGIEGYGKIKEFLDAHLFHKNPEDIEDID